MQIDGTIFIGNENNLGLESTNSWFVEGKNNKKTSILNDIEVLFKQMSYVMSVRSFPMS